MTVGAPSVKDMATRAPAEYHPSSKYHPAYADFTEKDLESEAVRKSYMTHLLTDRQRGRTDLYWLCTRILGYDRVGPDHLPLIESCQEFLGWDEAIDPESMMFCFCKPKIPLEHLQGNRFHLMLWPRGHLKTTINTIAHCIQWILNYPDIRILISTAIADQAQDMLAEMKAHFQYNEAFRLLYPEFCPPERSANRFGNTERFTVPNRQHSRKEPTIMMCSIGGVKSSRHYDVIKHSDVEDEENVKTDGGLKDTLKHFHLCQPLMDHYDVAPYHSWVTVEGTIYHFNGYHNTLLERQRSLDKAEDGWTVTHSSAELDEKKGLTLWPTFFPWAELKRIEREIGPTNYAMQYRLVPLAEGDRIATERDIVVVSHSTHKEIIGQIRLYMTVDLASMEEKASGAMNVLTVGGFDNAGRCRILSIDRGHFQYDEIINLMYARFAEYEQRFIQIRVEKTHHAEVLLPMITKMMPTRGWLPITPVTVNNKSSKNHQIISMLQPWFHDHAIIFSDHGGGMCGGCKISDIIDEATKFPAYTYKDILDTLVMMIRLVKGLPTQMAPVPREASQLANWQRHIKKRFVGWDMETNKPMWDYPETSLTDDDLAVPVGMGGTEIGVL